MKKNSRAGRTAVERVRDALLVASSTPDARVGHWIGAVPELLSESKKRRRVAITPADRISSAGRYWIPRLAPVTALLVAMALVWSAGSPGRSTSRNHSDSSLERWLVTGSDTGTTSDPLVNALAGTTPEDRRQ